MKVFIIGTGNVAKSLGAAILKAGHQVTGVLGRNHESAQLLAKKFLCKTFSSPKSIPDTSDFYIIAVNDDAITQVVKSLPPLKGIILHTSGSVDLKSLGKEKKRGVLYPVESITGKFNLSFKDIPVCLEASDETTMSKLLTFASTISAKIFLLDSPQRARLHVAAVFTNNFTNHLLGISKGIIDAENLPHELLYKLAQSTIKNAFEQGPFKSQTGPAKRNDKKTIQRHLEFLKENKDYADLYRMITRQIVSIYNKSKKQDKKS